MIKYLYMFLVAVCFSNGCDTIDNRNNEPMVLKSGTSFGFCIGYCNNEIQLIEDKVIYKELSRDKLNYPTRTIGGTISRAEWNALLNAVDLKTLDKLDNVYGCPDCTDGGAEWIEVYYDNFHKKVIFEYGDTIKPVESLILQMRTLRKRFEP